jgi:5S rRNA maturation endonuclease (ribonuclease M5)
MDYKEIKELVDMPKLLGRLGYQLDKNKRCACPIHGGDNKTAFSVSNDGQSWTCHTKCNCGGGIFQFIEKLEGVSVDQAKIRIQEMFALSDDRPIIKAKAEPEKEKVVVGKTVYVYRDDNGEEIFRVNRVDYADGRKDCFQECNGSRTLPANVRTLYNRHLMAKEPDAYVFLCEGEKTADALVSVGVIATTNPLGSKSWKPEYADLLKNRKVVLMPDADEHGETWRDEVLKSLRGKVEKVQIISMPEKFIREHPEFTGHDFADYLKINKDTAEDDLMAWLDASDEMPRGIDAKILGRPADGFRELSKRAKLGISNDVFNLRQWLPTFDLVIKKGDMLVLMANTSVGKTRLLHNMPYFIRHVNYAMFDLELSFETLCERYAAMQNGLSVREFEEKIMAGFEMQSPQVDNVYIQKIAKLTVTKIRERVEELELLTGKEIHCVGVDYIGLMTGTGSKYESTSDNVEEFKAYISEVGKVGILTTQVARPTDKENGMYQCPSPFSAKNSGSIECSAQELIGFWKDEHEKNRIWARCLKYTHGEYPYQDVALHADNLEIREERRYNHTETE